MTFDLSHLTIRAKLEQSPLATEDFSQVLQKYALSYKETGYYWQVGEITLVQGWIVHISVIRSQIVDLLQAVIPVLLSHEVSFKIVKDKDTAKSMLDGDFGQSQVGKLICIYPTNLSESIALVRHLVSITEAFQGPAVPTDFHLGGNVYTRWGSFNPINMADARGIMHRYIYDAVGNLKPDIYTIPFALPDEIEWPFESIASYHEFVEKKVFLKKYKVIFTLSFNAKGNVFKGIYLKHLLQTKPCVIKQGLAHMWSDDYGRDIKDRLYWQWELYRDWGVIIRVPKIFDLFEEDGNTYLVMEEIKGKTLHEYAMGINSHCNAWQDISPTGRLAIVRLIMKLIHIVSCIHQKGYVHRDITPVNFLVEKNEDLVPIDAELSASIVRKQPSPPFEGGTHGFMSAEQTRVDIPTLKEDVFGLCATIITLLVGLPPGIFEKMKKDFLYQNLLFFIGDEPICRLLMLGIQSDPDQRPSLKIIQNTLESSAPRLVAPLPRAVSAANTNFDEGLVRSVIQNAIRGLVAPPMSIHKDLWYSRMPSSDYIPGSQRKEFGKSGGTYEGITGVLYLLGIARMAGFDIDTCLPAYEKGWAYVREKYCTDLSHTVPGLYGGAAGIVLAMKTGMKAGLVQNNETNRYLIRTALELHTPALDLSQGIAGQGIVALQCQEYVEKEALQNLLIKLTRILLSAQQKSGDWVVLHDSRGKKGFAASLSFGNTGIIWFLLEYLSKYHDPLVESALAKSLASLNREAAFFSNFLKKYGFRKSLENPVTSDGIPGVALVLIKAYEVLKEPLYRNVAISILDSYPNRPVHENISQDVGLTGLGELYQEAHRVFGDSKWQERISWFVNFLLHTRTEDIDGRCYWLNNNAALPTADLMVGTSGVIHFLMKALFTNKIGYRLLY